MTETEIENTIRRYILFKKKISSEENDKDILFNKKLLLDYMKKFNYFSRRIVSSKNNIIDNLISKILEQIEFIFVRKDSNIWNIGDSIENVFFRRSKHIQSSRKKRQKITYAIRYCFKQRLFIRK